MLLISVLATLYRWTIRIDVEYVIEYSLGIGRYQLKQKCCGKPLTQCEPLRSNLEWFTLPQAPCQKRTAM